MSGTCIVSYGRLFDKSLELNELFYFARGIVRLQKQPFWPAGYRLSFCSWLFQAVFRILPNPLEEIIIGLPSGFFARLPSSIRVKEVHRVWLVARSSFKMDRFHDTLAFKMVDNRKGMLSYNPGFR
jgi:hypothetical protein